MSVIILKALKLNRSHGNNENLLRKLSDTSLLKYLSSPRYFTMQRVVRCGDNLRHLEPVAAAAAAAVLVAVLVAGALIVTRCASCCITM